MSRAALRKNRETYVVRGAGAVQFADNVLTELLTTTVTVTYLGRNLLVSTMFTSPFPKLLQAKDILYMIHLNTGCVRTDKRQPLASTCLCLRNRLKRGTFCHHHS